MQFNRLKRREFFIPYGWKVPLTAPTMQLCTLVLVAALSCTLTSTCRADLWVTTKSNDVTLFISGAITDRDAKAAETLQPELERSSFLTVMLDSAGGDVDAAMRIGRLIREYEGMTIIGKDEKISSFNANCYSSCALIFIAGVSRIIQPGGLLGLHRPYLASTPQSRQVIEKQVPLVYSQVKQYISEMGIFDNFYYEMMNTEPSKMVVYGDTSRTKKSNDKIGIRTARNEWTGLVPERDPVSDEIITANQARRHGVTTDEMRQRKRAAEACPKYDTNYVDCSEAIHWGLSERVYRERNKRASATCAMRGEDRKLYLSLPKRERRDHPLIFKEEACIRDIMLGRN